MSGSVGATGTKVYSGMSGQMIPSQTILRIQSEPFFAAGDFEGFKALLRGKDVPSYSATRLLISLCHYCKPDISLSVAEQFVDFLIEFGASFEFKEYENELAAYPLITAIGSEEECLNLIRALLNKGADPLLGLSSTWRSITAMELAARQLKFESLAVLIKHVKEKGKKVDAQELLSIALNTISSLPLLKRCWEKICQFCMEFELDPRELADKVRALKAESDPFFPSTWAMIKTAHAAASLIAH